MSEKTALLKTKSTVALPLVIVLPKVIVSQLGIPRKLTVANRSQLVPEAVARWLVADVRYNDWFQAEFEESGAEKAEAPEKPETRAKPKPKPKPKAKTKSFPKLPETPSVPMTTEPK